MKKKALGFNPLRKVDYVTYLLQCTLCCKTDEPGFSPFVLRVSNKTNGGEGGRERDGAGTSVVHMWSGGAGAGFTTSLLPRLHTGRDPIVYR